MNLLIAILAAQAIVTPALTGLIWFVQLVHYPLFARVGVERSSMYAMEHARRTTRLVAPLMIIELTLALITVFVTTDSLRILSIFGMALIGGIWLSTFTVQVPCHTRLTCSFDPVAHRELTRSNWVRTILWTTRSFIAIWMLIEATVA